MTSAKLYLEKILAAKLEEVRLLKMGNNLEVFRDAELYHTATKNFKAALINSKNISIITEIKKASPSKGIIRDDFDFEEIAQTYMNCGADAISVLTEKKYFHGNINFISSLFAEKKVPILRKDFIFDEIQIHEARAYGADAVLLISEILEANQIKDLSLLAQSLNLEVLLEIHSMEQFDKIDFELNDIIGINNRNLEDFSVDISTTMNISETLPNNIIIVSESGIDSQAKIELLKGSKVNAILVGEYLMRSKDISKSLNELIQWCKR